MSSNMVCELRTLSSLLSGQRERERRREEAGTNRIDVQCPVFRDGEARGAPVCDERALLLRNLGVDLWLFPELAAIHRSSVDHVVRGKKKKKERGDAMPETNRPVIQAPHETVLLPRVPLARGLVNKLEARAERAAADAVGREAGAASQTRGRRWSPVGLHSGSGNRRGGRETHGQRMWKELLKSPPFLIWHTSSPCGPPRLRDRSHAWVKSLTGKCR